jgi:uncharacterized protein (TIGR02145 family)
MKNLLRISALIMVICVIHSCKKDEDPNTVTDIDGNIYHTVTIGTQVWMVENLKTTKYRDGSHVPIVKDYTEWMILTTPGYCWYDNNQATYKGTYGALYNWHAVNTGKLCPTGWHVPTDAEWVSLMNYLGGLSEAGGKLKELGTAHWDSPNSGATNETGFTALAAGCRGIDGSFILIGQRGAWWSVTEYNAWSAMSMNIDYNDSEMKDIAYGKTNGMSARCMKD